MTALKKDMINDRKKKAYPQLNHSIDLDQLAERMRSNSH
jgi:hypothetical protein